jgi:hypothetical protein
MASLEGGYPAYRFICSPPRHRRLRTIHRNFLRPGKDLREFAILGRLLVNISPVSYANNEDDNAFVFYRADYPVITDPVFPESFEVFSERIPKTARVILGGDLFPQKANYTSLRPGVQFLELLDGFVFPLNPPDQVPFPPLPSSTAVPGF